MLQQQADDSHITPVHCSDQRRLARGIGRIDPPTGLDQPLDALDETEAGGDRQRGNPALVGEIRVGAAIEQEIGPQLYPLV